MEETSMVSKTIVDIAQVLSAVGTVAAVIAAFMLARRNETPRAALFAGVRHEYSFGPAGSIPIKCFFTLSVVNAGLLPVSVRYTSIRVPRRIGVPWELGVLPDIGTTSPFDRVQRLEHGHDLRYSVEVTREEKWEGVDRRFWWPWQRPSFEVTTTLGRTYRVCIPYSVLRTARRFYSTRSELSALSSETESTG